MSNEQVKTEKKEVALKEAKSKMTWDEITKLKFVNCQIIYRKREKNVKPNIRVVANLIPGKIEFTKTNLTTNEVTGLMLFHDLNDFSNVSDQIRNFKGYVQFKIGHSKEDGTEFRALSIYFTEFIRLDQYLTANDLAILDAMVTKGTIKSIEWYEIPSNVEFVDNSSGAEF